jgi:hypothetical protein
MIDIMLTVFKKAAVHSKLKQPGKGVVLFLNPMCFAVDLNSET